MYVYEYMQMCISLNNQYMHILYIHTPIYTSTYLHTYVRTYVHTYIRACIHAYMHTCIHAYIHAHIMYTYYMYRGFTAYAVLSLVKESVSGGDEMLLLSCFHGRRCCSEP